MLIGQRQVETILARQLARGRTSHAYLFLGPPGSGKTTAARLLAQALNCEHQPAASGDESAWRLTPCGACESCRRIAADTHPEVQTIFPQSKTGQNITVEQSREIRRNAALRPKMGKSRVYIVPEAETFSDDSANALLKTLEEPSPFVTLILCAPSPSQVLPTIRSRCQIMRFGLAAPAEVAAALVQRGVEVPEAELLARVCGGRPGLALTWVGQPAALNQRRAIQAVIARAIRHRVAAGKELPSGIQSLRLAEQLRGLVAVEKAEKPEKAAKSEKADKDEDEGRTRPAKALHSENLEVALDFLRDLLLLTEGAPGTLARNQDRLPELVELAQGTSSERLMEDIHSVREAQQLLDRNVSPQLVLERMFWSIIRGPLPLPSALFDDARL